MPTTPYTARGERCPGAKLTVDQVRFIRREYHTNPRATLLAFARLFDVHRNTIRKVLMRASWNHVLPEEDQAGVNSAATGPRAWQESARGRGF